MTARYTGAHEYYSRVSNTTEVCLKGSACATAPTRVDDCGARIRSDPCCFKCSRYLISERCVQAKPRPISGTAYNTTTSRISSTTHALQFALLGFLASLQNGFRISSFQPTFLSGQLGLVRVLFCVMNKDTLENRHIVLYQAKRFYCN